MSRIEKSKFSFLMRDFDSDRDFCQSGEVRYKEKNPRHIAAGDFFEEGKAIERKSFVSSWSIFFLILLIREKVFDKRERKLWLTLSFIFTEADFTSKFRVVYVCFFSFQFVSFQKEPYLFPRGFAFRFFLCFYQILTINT